MTFTATRIGTTKRFRLVEIAGVTGTIGDIKRWASICYPGATIKKVGR